MKKIFVLFFVLFFLSIEQTSAHVGGGPPFLMINGKYAPTNPFFSNDPNINIPQDTNPYTEKLLVNQQIHFGIDTSKLLVPPDVAAASTFRWTMDENSSSHLYGTNLAYAYKTPGSHLITLEAKGPGEIDFLVIDTTQVDILPNTLYKIPQTAISVATDKRDSTKPIHFMSTIHTDPHSKITKMIWGFGDGDDSNEVNPLHQYTNTANYATFPVVFRVYDNHGFFRDAGIIVQIQNGKFSFIDANGKANTIPISDTLTQTSSPNQKQFPIAVVWIGITIVVVIGGIVMLKYVL